jgi:hypothetical protein
MATITLNVPDAVLPRVVEALCVYGQRPDDSPEARGVFAKGVVVAFVRHVTMAHEAQQAAESARAAAEARAAADVTIT